MMRYFRWLLLSLIGVLCLGMIGSLLAQDAEKTEEPPIPIDCSTNGMRSLLRLIELRYPSPLYGDRYDEPDEVTSRLSQLSYFYARMAEECGDAPAPVQDRENEALLHELLNDLVTLHEQKVGYDVITIEKQLEVITGDPAHGEALYNAETRSDLAEQLPCIGCHQLKNVAPLTEDIWKTTVETRLKLAEFVGYTAEEYIIESILLPDAYMVPGYADTMPSLYGEQMSAQDLADIVAYLHSLSTEDANN